MQTTIPTKDSSQPRAFSSSKALARSHHLLVPHQRLRRSMLQRRPQQRPWQLDHRRQQRRPCLAPRQQQKSWW